MIQIKKVHIQKLGLFMLMAATLQSCFVAKNYERPELAETDNLYRTDMLPKDSISMADVSWKDLFTDSQLKQYITEGLENNLDIRVAIQQMEAAQSYLKQGKAGYFPTLSGNATATRSYLSGNGQQGAFLSSLGRSHIDQFELSGALAWEADIWGKIRSNKRALGASYLQSVAAHQAVKTQLVASIASTYYQLLALDAQLKVTKESVDARNNSVSTVQALKDAGQTTQVAVDQNIAQYNNAKALQVDLEAAIFQLENAFNLLLGRPADTVVRGELSEQALTSELQLGVPAALLSNRPDVMQSEFALINAFELTNVARSNFYPSLTLNASGGFQSLDFDMLFDSTSLFASLVGGLAQPIFNGRAIRTQHEIAKAQQEQALLNFKKSLLTAGNEVSNALYNYNAQKEKITYVQNEVEALRQAESHSEELLNNGLANYLEVLTARQSALTSELSYITTQYDQLNAIVSLYQALGGGWR